MKIRPASPCMSHQGDDSCSLRPLTSGMITAKLVPVPKPDEYACYKSSISGPIGGGSWRSTWWRPMLGVLARLAARWREVNSHRLGLLREAGSCPKVAEGGLGGVSLQPWWRLLRG